jgi:hypothetical protein
MLPYTERGLGSAVDLRLLHFALLSLREYSQFSVLFCLDSRMCRIFYSGPLEAGLGVTPLD